MSNYKTGYWRILLIALTVAVTAAMSTTSLAAGAGNPGQPGGAERGAPAWVEGRVLVQPRAGVSEARLRNVLAAHNARSVERIRGLNVHVISVPPQAEDAVVRALSRNPNIKFAEKDYLVSLSEVPNDPRFDDAWHHRMIESSIAWRDSKGNGVVVAVLDTGVDAGHPDLQGKLVTGWNAVDQSQDTADIHGHGTRVAGTIGAATDNATGVAAVGWNAKVMPIRVTNRSDGVASSSDMARGLTWAADNGADVANMSYASWRHATVASAAQYMRNKGGIVFGSAGNNGADMGYAPTAHTIVVAATTSSDNTASWSNYGDYVDLSAPGAGILTTSRGGGYSSVSGTSFSSPVAAAVAALVKAANPHLSPGQIEQILYDSADDRGAFGWDPHFGWGRVNAARAVQMAGGTSSADFEPPEVRIASPGQGAKVHGLVEVRVEATDNVGVARVVLYADGREVGTETVAPYEFAWDSDGVAEGSVRLRAEAFDEAGNQSAHSIDVTVERPQEEQIGDDGDVGDTEPPVVQIVSPSDGEQVSGNIRITARATDNVGVSMMQMHINGTLHCVGDGGELRCSWQTRHAADGDHLISVTAEDAAGNRATTSVTVRVGSSSSDDDGGGNGGGPPPGRGNNR